MKLCQLVGIRIHFCAICCLMFININVLACKIVHYTIIDMEQRNIVFNVQWRHEPFMQ